MLHIIYYRILSSVRNKSDIFWILFFPIILGTCFFAAFSDIYDTDMKFESVPVAAVVPEESRLRSVLDVLAKQGMEEGDEPMLKVTYTDMEHAEKMLSQDKAEGIIEDDGEVHLYVKENGIEATFLQSILDEYVQTMDIIGNADAVHMADIMKILANLQSDTEFIESKSISSGELNPYTDYFYSLIAMACLYASLLGLNCAKQMKADLSPLGMRKCLVPARRLKIIVGDMLGCYIIQCIANVLLILYLHYILGINLGERLSLVLLTAFMGSLIGLSLGVFIGSIPKIGEGVRYGINITVTMVSCFLSGLMMWGMRWLIEENVPVLNRINPATVISDALYSLNIYDTYERFAGNLLILLGMSVILCILSFVMVRRESYEQL